MYDQNMKMLSTIQNAKSNVKTHDAGLIVRRPLYHNKFRKSVQRYMEHTKPARETSSVAKMRPSSSSVTVGARASKHMAED